ncbi:MAG: class I SAM-dependent methyltransferase [Dehalococcoidia bacterium]
MTPDADPRGLAPTSWFDQEVAAYERARPSYPDALFEDLIAYLRAGGCDAPFDAIEIGPGTGKATASLIDRGFRVTAVEPGANMAAFLREKFAGKPLDVVHARFEDATLPDSSFDAVVSATSFGWVDKDVRLTKSSRLLRARGVLAVIGTEQIASDVDGGFFERCFPIYLRYRPNEENRPLPGEDVTPSVLEEVEASGLFGSVRLHRYRWDQTYPTDQYADLVRSYSNTQMMPRDEKEALIADLCALIDAEFDGYVVRPLVMTLVVGRKA